MDFNKFLKDKFEQEDFKREYYREAALYRLADQLLLLRKKLGLTQKELAKKANTTQAVVSRIENVSVSPSLETVIKLADALNAVVDLTLKPIDEVHPYPEKTTKKDTPEKSTTEPRKRNLFFEKNHPPMSELDEDWFKIEKTEHNLLSRENLFDCYPQEKEKVFA